MFPRIGAILPCTHYGHLRVKLLSKKKKKKKKTPNQKPKPNSKGPEFHSSKNLFLEN